jgi:ligand-binding sensor domain-containing protein/DNA-binding NarL/FixJ family response regulator
VVWLFILKRLNDATAEKQDLIVLNFNGIFVYKCIIHCIEIMNFSFSIKLFLALLFIGKSCCVSANDYMLTLLSSNDGLSQQDVECITQDKYGYIWIGTYDGLNRYDGNQFIQFRHIPGNQNSISDNRILSLAEWPERNELWIGTDGGGLNCYNLRTTKFKHYPGNSNKKTGLTDNQISCLYKSESSLWIGTTNGPHRLDFTPDGEAVITHYQLLGAKNNEESMQYIVTLMDDNFGNIIAGTMKGLYQKKVNEDEFKPVPGMEKNIKQVLKDMVGNLWILSKSDIYFYSTASQKIQNYLSNPTVLNFTSPDPNRKIIPVSENLLILATDRSVFWVRQNYNIYEFEEIFFSKNSFFSNNRLKALLVDQSMNVWLTSQMYGIARFDLNAKSIYEYPLNHAIAGDKNFIQTIIRDSKDRIWIGSSNGVFIKDPNKETTVKLDKINDMVYGIVEDKYQNLWITSFYDLHYIPKGNIKNIKKIDNKYNLPENVYPFDGPYAICQDTIRDIIWVGMRSGILQIKQSRNGRLNFHLKDIQPYEAFRTVNNVTILHYNDKNNSLLIGTKNAGLLQAELSDEGNIVKVATIGNVSKEKEEHIWSMLESSGNAIYVGTDSGLKKLIRDAGGNFDLIPVDSDDSRLQSYKIVSIVEDNDRNLWLSTSLGLLRYSPKSKQVIQYFYTDGLITNILSEGTLYDSKKNILYLGTINGINVVDLSSLNINNVAPITQFNALRVNNKMILPGEEFNGRILLENAIESTDRIELKYNENNFTVEFASLHFSNPSKNLFSYRLQGFSDEWTEVSNNVRSATYTNLPSGKYTLLVKSSNGDGVWNESPKNLAIVIKPALWNTIWAYCLYTVVIILILYFSYKYYNDRQKIKNALFFEQIEHKKEIEIAEEKLKYHTNITHELRTPLSLIIAPTNELLHKSYKDEFLNSQLNIIQNNANRLLQLLNQFLDFRKVLNGKYSLNVSKENVLLLLGEIKNYFSGTAKQKNISIELYNDMSTSFCWCDKEIITKICSNLLSNAIKYTPDRGKILMYLSQNNDNSKLYISVEDTGIGIEEKEQSKIFNRFYQVSGSIGGTGIGLNLSQQLAFIHKGYISVKSRVGEGSIFTLEIPINRNEYEDETVVNTLPEVDEKYIEPETENVEIKTKPMILIVEDNYELRDYISKLLKEEAIVLIAGNGEEGYNMAVNNIPDLIVSDIMMPVMDGIEMTSKCKEDIRTSHIPIILLTAKETHENEIEGLSYGADDYIIKPFNTQILKLRIKKLLKLTRKEIEEVNKGKRKLNEREQQFLKTFENMVFDNISSPEFGIDEMCKVMAMSRMQLYRKMAAIINKKPSQYVKELKMKKAYELIKEKGMNITEAMYEVGYSNYSYFSKKFTEVNSISPREVLGMKKQDNAKNSI